MNIKVYEMLMKKYFNLKNLYYTKEIDICNIDNNLICLLKDNNIKNMAKNIYSKIISKNMKIITILDLEYPKILLNRYKEDIPFCIICEKNINLNNKNVYIYFNKYFSEYGHKIMKYFIKIINNNKCNVISRYDKNDVKCLDIKYINLNEDFELNFKGIMLTNKRHL